MENELKPCTKCKTFCCVEIIETMAKPPKNIRIGCKTHSVWLHECFSSPEEAANAWNRRVNDG